MTSRAGCPGAITRGQQIPGPPSVLLVEPWFEGSHRAWAEGYQANSGLEIALLTLPGRYWRWRLRGAAVSLAAEVAAFCDRHGPPDVLLASSMVDLAALSGLARRSLANTVVVSYMHENQVAYPHQDAYDVDAAYRSWGSMVASDMILVNSRHHLDVVETGLRQLLVQAPDRPHVDHLDDVLAKARVLPVGVDLSEISSQPTVSDPPIVLWNHRWDADKHPEVFVRALERIAADGIDFAVVLAGSDAWDGDARRREAEARLGSRVLASGNATRIEYLAHLERADVAVSVADHEFFGVAIVEAMAAGCVPVLPRSLSYPELVPPRFHDRVFYEPGGFRSKLAHVLQTCEQAKQSVRGLAGAMQEYDWSTVAPLMDETLSAALAGRNR